MLTAGPCAYAKQVIRYQLMKCLIASTGHLHWMHTLHWRYNEHDGVSNRQPHDFLLNRFFRCRSKKISKLRVIGLCEGNSPVAGEFHTPRASNAENVSICWRHHDLIKYAHTPIVFYFVVVILWDLSQSCYFIAHIAEDFFVCTLWLPQWNEWQNRLIPKHIFAHDDVIEWKHFRVTGPLWGKSTNHRWILLTKASNVFTLNMLSYITL